MTPQDIETLEKLLTNHVSIVVLGAFFVGLLVRLSKTARFEALIRREIPAKHRPKIVILLAGVAAAAEKIVMGQKPLIALVHGVGAIALAIGGHQMIIEKMRGGRELGESVEAHEVRKSLRPKPPRAA